MLRPVVLSVSALLLITSCAPAFRDRRTPSGDFCSDMAVIPADEEPNLEFHRLQPVQSDITAHTEAERLESLRRAACIIGGDAVIEAVNEEVRNDQGQYVLVSSGTAVVWSRPKGSQAVPLELHKKKSDGTTAGTGTPAATSAPSSSASATIPSAPVTAQPTSAPVATAAPTATAAPSATATAAPSASSTAKPPIKSKLPTNAAPKPISPKK
jgi:hypothetical protein